LLGSVVAGGITACGAYQYFDKTMVIVYARDLEFPTADARYIEERWAEDVVVRYAPSRLKDLRERRYGISIGKYVLNRYGRDAHRALQEVTQRIVAERSLCANGWSMVSRGIFDNGSGGATWTVRCNDRSG
jgi:hypothetical protein